MSNRIGLYLHVPFCEGKCPYRDFYSRRGSGEDYDRFLAAMIEGLFSAPVPQEQQVDTIYFGGGTPTLLGADRLVRLLEAALRRFAAPPREITLEANPCSVDAAMLQALRRGGFTRISFGVQSLCDKTLAVLGRRHTAERAIAAIDEAAQAGFSHISADLMLAVPGQTTNEIAESIDRLCACPIDHLSAYLLKLEPGTAFHGRYPEPDEDFAADCYRTMVARCEGHGFSQYEISNFAKSPAAQSAHNLIYWRCGEYLGLGPSAHSFFGGRRFYFPRDLDAFLNAPNVWNLTVDDGMGGDEEERIMLGLRLASGISLSALSPERRQTMGAVVPRLESAGLLTLRDGKVSLTTEGFLVSNAVIAALLGL